MASAKLHSSNPESLTYQNEMLQLTVLGGIKLEGLDRMRATLKVQLKNSSVPPLRHNLDLHNDTQVEKLVRKAAERLEIGTSVLSASIHELIEQLETYRLEQIEANTPKAPEIPTLTAEERKAAAAFLKSTNLMDRTNDLIGESGVIGEVNNRLLMLIIFTSRKREHPLHIVSLGASGMGKSHLQEKVGELIPDEDRLSLTCLSENAFYYFERKALAHKLILIEDLDGAENALYPLRELQSKKRISKTIAQKDSRGNTQTKHLVVEGPLLVAGCTTKEQIYEDNANRSFLIYLDESTEQDQRIMAYQRAMSAGKVNTEKQSEATRLLQNAQRLLEPVKVVNPYAELLCLPLAVFKPRRTNTHYLQFIEAVTFYHQFQREQKADPDTGELFIETTLEDIEAANGLLKEVLLRKSDELSGACRNYLESIRDYLKTQKKKEFNNQEIRSALRINPSNQKRYNLQLFSHGYLVKTKGKAGKAYTYRIASDKEYTQLQEQIHSGLDVVLEKARQFSGSKRFTSPNEPVKRQKIKAIKS